MAVESVTAESFIELSEHHPVFDVRSPGEFAHAHIPGAYSLPLFTDAERASIGTAYKQDSRQAAIKIGLDAFGPRMRRMVEVVEEHMSRSACDADQTVLVHCWRGGMRSAAVAWLLDLYGFKVILLEGGYKAYRQWVIAHWENAGAFRTICGYTGSGKTDVLTKLEKLGEPVLDFEALAGHKGSAFGNLERIPQPSQEMFENRIAKALHQTRKQHGDRAIWIEDESQRLGDVNIPTPLFRAIRRDAQGIFLELPFEQRLDAVVKTYGKYPTELLINAIVRIKKRLGPLETKTAIAHLVEGDVRSAFAILLQYYDKGYYPTALTEMPRLDGTGMSPVQIAERLISMVA